MNDSDQLSLYLCGLLAACVLLLALIQWRSHRAQALLALAFAAVTGGVAAALGGKSHEALGLLAIGTVLAALAGARARTQLVTDRPAPTGRIHLFGVVSVLTAAGVLRFVNLGGFPDFIHGEENIWTWTVATRWFSAERPWPITWYFKGVPVSYYQEWPFFKLFGLNYVAPRYEVAFFGLLAVGLFYLMTRLMFGPRTGLVASVFMATSMVALAASRAAFVQSHVLFWIVATFTTYAYAVDLEAAVVVCPDGNLRGAGFADISDLSQRDTSLGSPLRPLRPVRPADASAACSA